MIWHFRTKSQHKEHFLHVSCSWILGCVCHYRIGAISIPTRNELTDYGIHSRLWTFRKTRSTGSKLLQSSRVRIKLCDPSFKSPSRVNNSKILLGLRTPLSTGMNAETRNWWSGSGILRPPWWGDLDHISWSESFRQKPSFFSNHSRNGCE
jgi:hypothetical protein